jgi:hypothetical protein
VSAEFNAWIEKEIGRARLMVEQYQMAVRNFHGNSSEIALKAWTESVKWLEYIKANIQHTEDALTFKVGQKLFFTDDDGRVDGEIIHIIPYAERIGIKWTDGESGFSWSDYYSLNELKQKNIKLDLTEDTQS